MTRRVILGLFLGLLGCVDARAAQGELRKERFKSDALGGESRRFDLYLPPGYDPTCARRYPVLIVLHGLGGNQGDFFGFGGLHQALDRLIGEGRVQPLIAAAPDGGSDYWSNHRPAQGQPARRFGDYVSEDLVAHLDAHFCTEPRGSARAIAGVSMGGFGALSLALQHPDRFKAAVSLSGALFLEAPTHRKIYAAIWGKPPDPAVWDRVSPVALLRRLDPTATGNPLLYLLCGSEDSLGFAEYAKAAHQVLADKRIPHGLDLRPGSHTWEFWREVTREGAWLVWVSGALSLHAPPTP